MRRRFLVLALVSIATVMTGCSVTQVTAWFAFYRHQTVSPAQARSLADAVNPKLPAGQCDSNYAGGCVPNNQAVVHCAGLPGDGPAVTGPLQVTGWDHFHLDPDGDKVACPGDPVGAVDVIQQSVYGITIAGWALDPDTTSPLRIDVYDGATGHSITADGDRPDLATAFPGDGTAHGFSERFNAAPGTHEICIFAINGAGAGSNTLLTCKGVAVERVNPYDQFDTGAETMGLLETADTDPNGTLHVSGFVYDEDTGAIPDGTRLYIFFATGAVTIPITSANRNIARPDVMAVDPAAPLLSGFDITIPHDPNDSFGFAILQQPTSEFPDGFPVSSRLVNETSASPQLPLLPPPDGFTDPFNP